MCLRLRISTVLVHQRPGLRLRRRGRQRTATDRECRGQLDQQSHEGRHFQQVCEDYSGKSHAGPKHWLVQLRTRISNYTHLDSRGRVFLGSKCTDVGGGAAAAHQITWAGPDQRRNGFSKPVQLRISQQHEIRFAPATLIRDLAGHLQFFGDGLLQPSALARVSCTVGHADHRHLDRRVHDPGRATLGLPPGRHEQTDCVPVDRHWVRRRVGPDEWVRPMHARD